MTSFMKGYGVRIDILQKKLWKAGGFMEREGGVKREEK